MAHAKTHAIGSPIASTLGVANVVLAAVDCKKRARVQEPRGHAAKVQKAYDVVDKRRAVLEEHVLALCPRTYEAQLSAISVLEPGLNDAP